MKMINQNNKKELPEFLKGEESCKDLISEKKNEKNKDKDKDKIQETKKLITLNDLINGHNNLFGSNEEQKDKNQNQDEKEKKDDDQAFNDLFSNNRISNNNPNNFNGNKEEEEPDLLDELMI